MTDKTERLVGSSYRDLSPSPAIEEELMANLPERQAGPRRPAWIPIAAMLLIGVAIAIGRSRGSDGAIVETIIADGAAPLALVEVSRPRIGIVHRSTNEVHVRAARGGRVQVVRGKTWTDVNLNELGEHLGHAGKDKWVVLHVDRDTPWVHVLWMMTICAEQRMPKLAFHVKNSQAGGRDFRLDASLAVDVHLRVQPAADGTREVKVSILAVPSAEAAARWGAQDVLMPTQVRYEFADHSADELASVARWMRQAKTAAPRCFGELKAMGKTPFGTVARLLAEFRHAGFARVDFYGGRFPKPNERAAKTLPYPGQSVPKPNRQTLEFELAEGEAKDVPQAQAMIIGRLERAGIGNFTIRRAGNGIVVNLVADADADMVRRLVERQGATLVFHLTVESSDPAYDAEWKRLKQVGEASKGFRWYPLSEYGQKTYPKHRLPEGKHPYVLCRIDDRNITGASLEHVMCRRNVAGLGGDWVIQFDVRKDHQDNMKQLTANKGTYLAIIIDGEVYSSPVLQSQLSNSGRISGGFTEAAAKTLAVLLETEPLPVRFVETKN